MKLKPTIITVFLALGAGQAFGQYQTVVFNYEKSLFNDGRPLPAETYFTLSGAINNQVTLVEVKFYGKNGDLDRDPWYAKTWKRGYANTTERFELPINYKLRGNSEYDIYISYFRLATQGELKNLRDELFNSVDAYIDQNLSFDKRKINLLKNSGGMVQDLNSIVNSALAFYRSPTGIKFTGFSDLVLDNINAIEKSRQTKIFGHKATDAQNLLQKEKLIRDLKVRVHSEVAHLLNTDLSVLADTKYIDDYQVEKTRNIITLHGGYGGAFLEGDIDNYTIGSTAMAGFTLPLGRKAFTSGFWNRSSIMVGVYLKNFDTDGGYKVTGPIIERPIYLGVGYKVFQFFRVSGGVTALKNTNTSNAISDLKDNVYFRPYLGITADLNLWLGLGN